MKKNILFLTLLCAFSSAFAQVPSVSASTKWAVIDGNATWVPSALDLKNYCLLGFAGGTTGQVLTKNSGTDYDYSWAAGGGGASYLVYTALLTQSGTSAPTATILKNTLGVTPTFTYTTNGDYDITTSVDTFTANKTWVVCATGNQSDPAKTVPVLCSWTDVRTIRITTFPGGAGDDGYLVATPIEIRVYP